ncbi:hypothetical protein AGLY_004128 [Aphis glycines]|uniref:Uncharacterized protein n=1 Tax=Aphis glycines TaxID=307491 RepID=A0A6G0TZI7_APHGL|nr:hypothetical protein AGLY_004128 [Aphis glycines]
MVGSYMVDNPKNKKKIDLFSNWIEKLSKWIRKLRPLAVRFFMLPGWSCNHHLTQTHVSYKSPKTRIYPDRWHINLDYLPAINHHYSSVSVKSCCFMSGLEICVVNVFLFTRVTYFKGNVKTQDVLLYKLKIELYQKYKTDRSLIFVVYFSQCRHKFHSPLKVEMIQVSIHSFIILAHNTYGTDIRFLFQTINLKKCLLESFLNNYRNNQTFSQRIKCLENY